MATPKKATKRGAGAAKSGARAAAGARKNVGARKSTAPAKRSRAPADAATRDRIVEAALETLREEGFSGTTARAIAKRGAFNQALIFYYFGSVAALLLEAFRTTSQAQVAKYRAAAAEVGSLADLVQVARRLHDDDLESGAVTAVTQLMAAAVSDPSVGPSIMDRFEEWIGLVEDALGRAIENHPLGAFVPARQAAYAVCAMFLGIELMSRLDPERSEAPALFDMMGTFAQLIQDALPAVLQHLLMDQFANS